MKCHTWLNDKIHDCIVCSVFKTLSWKFKADRNELIKRSSPSDQQSSCPNMWVMLTINGHSHHLQPFLTRAAHPPGQMCWHSIHDLTLTADPSYLTTPEHAACLSLLQGDCLPSNPFINLYVYPLSSLSTPWSTSKAVGHPTEPNLISSFCLTDQCGEND